MKYTLLAVAITTLAAGPAFAGSRGGSSGSLVNVSGINVAALNGTSILNNVASGNRTVVSLPRGVLNGNRTNALNVQGVVKGLLGGGHGCGCN